MADSMTETEVIPRRKLDRRRGSDITIPTVIHGQLFTNTENNDSEIDIQKKMILTTSDILDAKKRLRRVKPTKDENTDSQLRNFESGDVINGYTDMAQIVGINTERNKLIDRVGQKPENIYEKTLYQNVTSSDKENSMTISTNYQTECDTQDELDAGDINNGYVGLSTVTRIKKFGKKDRLEQNEDLLKKENDTLPKHRTKGLKTIQDEAFDVIENSQTNKGEANPYAKIDDVKKNRRPPATLPKLKKSITCPVITVPPIISKDDNYECMTPKRSDLSESNIPTHIETNISGLAFRYEGFLSHIYYTSHPSDTNFKQDNFSAGLFTEDGGTLTVNGAHLTIPNGALKQPTVLFLYQVGNDPANTRQVGGVCMQYQVSPVIVVGPVTELQQSIFLTIDLYMVDGSEWTYEPKVRRSNDTSWEPLKSKSISIKQETRWIHTLQKLNHVTDFKLIGSPKRKNITDCEGLYDIPIDHFITVKISAVIGDVSSDELSISVRKIEDTTNENEWAEKTILLNQLGGEFLIMKLFGKEEKIHIGNILCGRQTFTMFSFKVPSTVYRNASIECRQELKQGSFNLNITRKDALKHIHGRASVWEKDLRTIPALLSRNRFNMITEFGQPGHWLQFCRLAFDFSDAQSTNFRTLPYYQSFAINLYTAVNDTCGNTLDLLKPLQQFLEDADILQAANLVKEEIEDCNCYIKPDSGSEDDGDPDDKDDDISSMHASLRRKASMTIQCH
ncbi:uncharacterized protein [Antedon mediterranea]|uniref:uncharacterized protein isoform X2 n=1 Tax=Antedon mediterranea TaxID=105859 RepID=UPI003AF69AD9